jgi:hypothetical protein
MHKMNPANCLAYCHEFKNNMPHGDTATARNVRDFVVKSARNEIKSIEDSSAVLAAKEWADKTLAAV